MPPAGVTPSFIYVKAYSNLMLIEPEVVDASRVFSPSRLPFKLQEPDVVEVGTVEKTIYRVTIVLVVLGSIDTTLCSD